MTPEQGIFAVAGPICVTAAAGAVMRRGPLGAALSLTIALFALAILYLGLGAPFLAAVQIAVYAGAVMVLLIFVVMLLGATSAAGVAARAPRLGAAGVVLAVALFGALAAAILRGQVPVNIAVVARDPDDVRAVGNALFGPSVFPFEIASVLLLAAMIGAVTIARKRSSEREWPGRR